MLTSAIFCLTTVMNLAIFTFTTVVSVTLIVFNDVICLVVNFRIFFFENVYKIVFDKRRVDLE